MSRYWQSRVWKVMTEFRRECGLTRTRRQAPKDAPRRLVLMAAYLGSPAAMTAEAVGLGADEVHGIERGVFRPTAIEMERLHDWLACCLWRHLWRAGSPDHSRTDAIEDAVRHAARLSSVPGEWARDWSLAAGGMEL